MHKEMVEGKISLLTGRNFWQNQTQECLDRLEGERTGKR